MRRKVYFLSWPQTVVEQRVHHRDSKKAPPTFSLDLPYSAARLRLYAVTSVK